MSTQQPENTLKTPILVLFLLGHPIKLWRQACQDMEIEEAIFTNVQSRTRSFLNILTNTEINTGGSTQTL